ncbi:MAG: porin family protein [Candidatus Aminicenantes bacterium]|nr:porin family protein [Candidatus Aminicenantes bacterium]
MSHRILITIIAVSICLSSFAVDLSAQDKKDNKRLEITSYLGTLQPHFYAPCVGLGLEYFISPRVSVDVEINYLPNTAFVIGGAPWGRYDMTIMESYKYRLLWDVNFMFYFDLTKVKRPMRWFLTVGTGFQYDRVEYTVVSLSTLEQDKYGYGSFWFQNINFGIGYKINIKDDWALRILYKIHRPSDDSITSRLALGLSYRF